jgi:hypothetical protein
MSQELAVLTTRAALTAARLLHVGRFALKPAGRLA